MIEKLIDRDYNFSYHIKSMNSYICPFCKKTLTKKDNSLICSNNHQFDISKEGYVNLLPANFKSSKQPGDNKMMMQARRAFLNSNSYLPLAEKLSEIIQLQLSNIENPCLLDLGCGEGYYTGYIADNLPGKTTFFALDISKVAIKYASKRYKKINFCVASAFDVPIRDNCFDIIIRNYAPSLETELQRLIKKGGLLVTVTPARRHLYQLRQIIYREVQEHPCDNPAPDGFNKVNQIRLSYPLNIDDPVLLQNLINMTPFAWKFTPGKINKIMEEKRWVIDCDFNIEIYKKF